MVMGLANGHGPGPGIGLAPGIGHAPVNGHVPVNGHGDAASLSKASSLQHGQADPKMADFFSRNIFDQVLHNPTTAHQLQRFSQARLCSENIDFLDKTDRYAKLINDLAKTAADIYHDFMSQNAARQVSLPQDILQHVVADIRTHFKYTLPQMEAVFQQAQQHVEELVYTDTYPRFVRYKMTMSALRALSSPGNRDFQGLGDCFCLTDPAMADNPIVAASDGFVHVTGYSRADIIPRNCRFLQGRHTDPAPVRRIKAAIMSRDESVELLLNYKKTGEPFWNLLYVAPLYNQDNKVVFFIGGQINCSTTIHSNADVIRILSQSDDVEEDKDKLRTAKAAPAAGGGGSSKLSLLRAFRSQQDSAVPANSEVEMENALLERIGNMELTQQMSVFYSAYSKYLVLSYDDLVINFYSAGIIDVLDPYSLAGVPVVGSDVFKFLGQHSSAIGRDFKQRVRAALKAGLALSLDLHLRTRRAIVFRGDEKFATHWTPLKDEAGRVNWVVLTMASASVA